METFGVFVLTFGAWLVYSGIHSFRPLKMIQAVIAAPGDAASTLAAAAALTAATGASAVPETGTMTNGLPLQAGVNPFSSYPVTTGFGEMEGSSVLGWHKHQGIDYGMPSGTHLPAILNGTVSDSNSVAGGGTVTIHGTGGYAGWTVIYMHCRKELLRSGTHVDAGTIVAESGGASGDPGRGDATGPHLHLEIHHNGAVVNPNSFFAWASANGKNKDLNMNNSFEGYHVPAIGSSGGPW